MLEPFPVTDTRSPCLGARRNEPANMQWGGRFAGGPSVIMQDINASIGFDRKLWRQDIRGSRRPCGDAGEDRLLISAEDEHAIASGLEAIAAGNRGRALRLRCRAGRHPHEHRGAADRAHRRGRASGCIPRAAATTRWRRIFACGCATRSTACRLRSPTRCWRWRGGRRSMRATRCRGLPICRRRSR